MYPKIIKKSFGQFFRIIFRTIFREMFSVRFCGQYFWRVFSVQFCRYNFQTIILIIFSDNFFRQFFQTIFHTIFSDNFLDNLFGQFFVRLLKYIFLIQIYTFLIRPESCNLQRLKYSPSGPLLKSDFDRNSRYNKEDRKTKSKSLKTCFKK